MPKRRPFSRTSLTLLLGLVAVLTIAAASQAQDREPVPWPSQAEAEPTPAPSPEPPAADPVPDFDVDSQEVAILLLPSGDPLMVDPSELDTWVPGVMRLADDSADAQGEDSLKSRANEARESEANLEPPAEPPVPDYDPWYPVRMCESTNNYAINTGNGFYGAYQFTISTWNWVAEIIGRADLIGVRPDLASPTDQDAMADALAFEVAGGGLGHWPVCGRLYGTAY